MLDDLAERIEKLQAFDNAKELQDIVDGNLETYVDLQRQQMIDGKDSDGQDVLLEGDGYQPATIEQKQKYGQGYGAITDHVTRYDTGALSQSLQAQMQGDEVLIDSPVEYWNDLEARVGPTGTGLDPENRAEFAETVVLPSMAVIMEEKLGITL